MGLIYKINSAKFVFFMLLLCVFTGCSTDTNDIESINHDYYYLTDDKSINEKQIGDGNGTFEPTGIAISNDKLYVCNNNALEVFDAVTLSHIKTIISYTKGSTVIPFTRLTSISIDNGKIYVGSADSRLFVLNENSTLGISVVGNGQWWNTFVHVFGVVVKDGLVFVKEKETTIKVFETSQITETSDWNIAPIAKLNTLNGWTEVYSMDVLSGNLVVAGRDAKSYLYYNIANIRANAAKSLEIPIEPTKVNLSDDKPVSISFGTEWAMSSESIGNLHYLRLYPINEFSNNKFSPRVNVSDIMGQNPLGEIVSTAQLNDRIFLSDYTTKQIRIVKLNKSIIAEQN